MVRGGDEKQVVSFIVFIAGGTLVVLIYSRF